MIEAALEAVKYAATPEPAAAPERGMATPRATDYLSREQLRELREVSTWRGLASIAGTWAWIAFSFGLYLYRPGWLTFAVGWLIMSGRHLGLAILMHDASHYATARNRRLNDWVGEWLTAYPTMLNMAVYRTIHMRHHRATWTEADPDLGLARPFPVSRLSFARKVLRDLTGRTGYARYRAIARLSAGLNPGGRGLDGEALWPALRRGVWSFARVQRGFLVTNGLLLALLTWLGHWEAFFLLWWLPALTGYSLVLRIRSIAEHAVIRDPSDPLLNTRTTIAAPWVRFFFAPHHVNYHIEHHLFMFVPHYRLPRAHQMLKEAGALERAEVVHGYRAVLRTAVV